LTLAVVAGSIVAHKISVTPLMKRNAARRGLDAAGPALHGSVQPVLPSRSAELGHFHSCPVIGVDAGRQ